LFLGGISPKGLAGKIAVVNLLAPIIDRHQSVSAKAWARSTNLQTMLVDQEGLDDRIRVTLSARNTSNHSVGNAAQAFNIVRKVFDHDLHTSKERTSSGSRRLKRRGTRQVCMLGRKSSYQPNTFANLANRCFGALPPCRMKPTRQASTTRSRVEE
jgi:hypothetical protein